MLLETLPSYIFPISRETLVLASGCHRGENQRRADETRSDWRCGWGANTEIEQVGVMYTDDVESVPRLKATAITNSEDDMPRLETSRNCYKSKRGEGVAE